MLEYIRGKLIETSLTKAVVETGGLGYLLNIPLNIHTKLPPLGNDILFFISTVIREDSHKLYGFLTAHERNLFEKLNEVSGIGPKTSLALLGHMEISDLELAISSANVALLSKVPGIGKKTAERLVIEMRDKVHVMEKTGATPLAPLGNPADAVQALIHLGYNALHAQKAVKAVLPTLSESASISDLITAALRSI